MPSGRIPGPYGRAETHGCLFYCTPVGRYPLENSETFCHTPGPLGTNADLGSFVAKDGPSESDVDRDELKALQSVYGVVSKTGKAYGFPDKKAKWKEDVAAYVHDRDAFLGSGDAYRAYKAKAIEELDADKGALRNVIEPPKEVRDRRTNWSPAQDVFYCWVRKAYEQKLGDKVDLPKLIKAGMSAKLRDALKLVRVDYGQHFQSGGFNPRPMKLSGKYRLGTISEHATGNAVDVESGRNAQVTSSVWAGLLAFTGKSLDHNSRKVKWQSAPEELFNAIKSINDEFVKRLAKAISEAETADAKTKGEDLALDAALAKDDGLKKVGKPFLKQWKYGFFTLDWLLVKAFQQEGFKWGATFPDPDLHHFEL